MTYSGMTADITKAMVAGTGSLYPLFAPIVGALGAFLTGSVQTPTYCLAHFKSAAAQGLDPTNFEDLGFWLKQQLTPGAAGIGKMLSPLIHRDFYWCRRSCFESIPRNHKEINAEEAHNLEHEIEASVIMNSAFKYFRSSSLCMVVSPSSVNISSMKFTTSSSKIW